MIRFIIFVVTALLLSACGLSYDGQKLDQEGVRTVWNTNSGQRTLKSLGVRLPLTKIVISNNLGDRSIEVIDPLDQVFILEPGQSLKPTFEGYVNNRQEYEFTVRGRNDCGHLVSKTKRFRISNRHVDRDVDVWNVDDLPRTRCHKHG